MIQLIFVTQLPIAFPTRGAVWVGAGRGGTERSQYMAVGNINFPFMDDYDILSSCYWKSILPPPPQITILSFSSNIKSIIGYRTLLIPYSILPSPTWCLCDKKKSPPSRQFIVCATKPASEIKSDYTFRWQCETKFAVNASWKQMSMLTVATLTLRAFDKLKKKGERERLLNLEIVSSPLCVWELGKCG